MHWSSSDNGRARFLLPARPLWSGIWTDHRTAGFRGTPVPDNRSLACQTNCGEVQERFVHQANGECQLESLIFSPLPFLGLTIPFGFLSVDSSAVAQPLELAKPC